MQGQWCYVLSCWCSQLDLQHGMFLLPAGPQMPLCLPGEMMAKQKTVLTVNLRSVTEETPSSLWKPLLSAHVFGALAGSGFVWLTWEARFIWWCFYELRSSVFSSGKFEQAAGFNLNPSSMRVNHEILAVFMLHHGRFLSDSAEIAL